MRSALIFLLLVTALMSAHAIVIEGQPNYNNNSNSNSLAGQINKKTTKALKTFKDMKYSKFSTDKETFFDDGGKQQRRFKIDTSNGES